MPLPAINYLWHSVFLSVHGCILKVCEQNILLIVCENFAKVLQLQLGIEMNCLDFEVKR